MITFLAKGDLFEQNTDAVVNTVNCVGVMGRGVALQFKNRYPENYKRYVAACHRGEVTTGKMFITPNDNMFGVKWIINFPTKNHWRYPSRICDIESGLNALVADIRRLGIRSIAMPPLGCGLGGLNWIQVRSLIEQKLSSLPDVDVRVFEPNDASVRETKNRKVPNMTVGRAVLLVMSNRYITESMVDFNFTLLALHKLMYFVQADGLELRLDYQKAVAGPYAQNLGNVLKRIEGYFIRGYYDGGDSPIKVLTLVPDAVRQAKMFLAQSSENVNVHVNRVLELVGDNADSAYLELLASVHWLVTREGNRTVDDLLESFHKWSARKLRFSRVQVNFAFNRLRTNGWI